MIMSGYGLASVPWVIATCHQLELVSQSRTPKQIVNLIAISSSGPCMQYEHPTCAERSLFHTLVIV